MANVTAGKTFSEEQQKWLGLIREHMTQNLTIDLSISKTPPSSPPRAAWAAPEDLYSRS